MLIHGENVFAHYIANNFIAVKYIDDVTTMALFVRLTSICEVLEMN